MTHLPQLITDLGLILAVAGITTLLFKKIRQPTVLGYILAGLLVGPYVSLLPTVADAEGIQVWSEIGVIFLLFSLGLEFSFKKLVAVGGSASITAITEIVIMIFVGFVTGKLLGWTTMDSIFLGALLSMSSTTIILRAFDELGVKSKKYATLVFGILIVEDLVAILLLVLLSTIAVSQQFAGAELGMQLLKLIFFLILWFLAGIFFIPTFLKRTRNLMSDENMLIVSIGLCLLMVILAVTVGFSAALGAFIMGSILAETTQAERIEHLVRPVKDLFAAVFFVSVGMMINPQVLIDYAVPVLVVTLITIFGKLISTTIGAIISGQSLKHSVQAGMSLAQIGEFSFIIASLGISLKVTSNFLYPIAVAASAVTTFTTPFFIKKSESLYTLLERVLPARWVNGINRYSSSTQQLSAISDWKLLLRAYALNIVIHAVLAIGIIVLSQRYLYPFISTRIADSPNNKIITVAITLIAMILPIWTIAVRRIEREAYAHLWLNRKLNRGPLIMLEIMRVAVAVALVGFLLDRYFSTPVVIIVALAVTSLVVVVFSRKLQQFYDRVEKRFLGNLNERETQKRRPEIAPWDAHLAEFEVPAESPLIGNTLQELSLRELYGINIGLIERGNITILTPDRYERLYPGDRVSVIGTDEQLTKVKGLFEESINGRNEEEAAKNEIILLNITLQKDTCLIGQSIRSTGIREQAKALIVGIERNGNRMLNPESTAILEDGDVLWIAGNKKRIKDFMKAQKLPAKKSPEKDN
jgi:CPA2 family monovalent cation:H+ antiporter-2